MDDNTKLTSRLAIPPLAVLGVAACALALATWSWWDSRETERSLTQSLGTRLAEFGGTQKQTTRDVEQLTKDFRDAQSRIRELEGKLSEFQAQRVALEAMARDLARAPDEWLLAEVEQTLNIASRELTLAGNVRAALAALQSLDQRLAAGDKSQFLPIRRAITQDMERLKALPTVDTPGISVKLDNLMSLAASLPLAIPDTARPAAQDPAKAETNDGFFSRIGKDLWQELKGLIRIHDLDGNMAALLSPQQSYFLRENLKLRLLSARTALIARDEAHYKSDLKSARDLLTRYFDAKAKVNINAAETLKQLGENPVSIAAPDINASLTAIRAMRTSRSARTTRD